MELKKTNLAEGKVKFLFMENNRSISQNKALRESILKKGVLQPLTVIRAADVDDGIALTDGSHAVSKQGNEKSLVILDGQHRYTELSDILDKKAQGKYEDVEVKPTISYIILNKSEVGNVNSYIIEMNSHSRNWKGIDYIENANKVRTDDLLIKTINKFKELKFSISAISRFLCFNVKGLTNETLAAYVNSNGEVPIKDADAERAIKLYLLFHFVGFTDGFMRKRYLIDYVINRSKVHGINDVLAKINVLTKAIEICSLKDKECDISSTMERIIDECFKQYTKDKGLNQDGIDELTKKDYLQDYDADDIADFFGEKAIEMIDAIEEQMPIPAQIGDDRCLTVNIPLS